VSTTADPQAPQGHSCASCLRSLKHHCESPTCNWWLCPKCSRMHANRPPRRPSERKVTEKGNRACTNELEERGLLGLKSSKPCHRTMRQVEVKAGKRTEEYFLCVRCDLEGA